MSHNKSSFNTGRLFIGKNDTITVRQPIINNTLYCKTYANKEIGILRPYTSKYVFYFDLKNILSIIQQNANDAEKYILELNKNDIYIYEKKDLNIRGTFINATAAKLLVEKYAHSEEMAGLISWINNIGQECIIDEINALKNEIKQIKDSLA